MRRSSGKQNKCERARAKVITAAAGDTWVLVSIPAKQLDGCDFAFEILRRHLAKVRRLQSGLISSDLVFYCNSSNSKDARLLQVVEVVEVVREKIRCRSSSLVKTKWLVCMRKKKKKQR